MTTGIYEGLAQAAGEMKAIPKDQHNTQQNFDFRSIESIVGHAKPLLEKYQLAIIPTGFKLISTEQVQSGKGARGWRTIVRGTWMITHADGSRVEASMLGEAVDYGDKSASKAVQMAYKYLLTQLLGVGSEDPDGITPEVMVTQPAPDLSKVIATKVAMFTQWGESQRKNAFTSHSRQVLGGKPTSADEVDQVITSMAQEYYEEFPDTAPF